MTGLNIILHDETQLVDWGESRAGGPWIKLRLSDPELLQQFRGMDTATLKKTGHILHCTLAEGDIAAAADEPEPDQDDESRAAAGEFWRALIAGGFFRAPQVCRAIGPESAFEDWIRSQPAVCGPDDYDEKTGEIRNQCAHVRRVAEGAGTSEKPPYFAVPLSARAHRFQHDAGERQCLSSYGVHVADEPAAKEWFDKQADAHRTEWASKRLCKKLRPELDWEQVSRTVVSPEAVIAWAHENDVERFLPKRVRQ